MELLLQNWSLVHYGQESRFDREKAALFDYGLNSISSHKHIVNSIILDYAAFYDAAMEPEALSEKQYMIYVELCQHRWRKNSQKTGFFGLTDLRDEG